MGNDCLTIYKFSLFWIIAIISDECYFYLELELIKANPCLVLNIVLFFFVVFLLS